MNIRKIKWSIPILVIVITGAFFAGILDRKPKIEIAKDDKIIFTDKRPSKTDENVIICVPAAFSSEDGIIGHYSVGTGRQGSTNRQYTTIRLDNKTHFQQATLVKDRQPKQFSDTKRRFRRALCKKGGRYYIEHSKLPVTLNDFARLLKEYDYAWNLDMGTYSYGWYRGIFEISIRSDMLWADNFIGLDIALLSAVSDADIDRVVTVRSLFSYNCFDCSHL